MRRPRRLRGERIAPPRFEALRGGHTVGVLDPKPGVAIRLHSTQTTERGGGPRHSGGVSKRRSTDRAPRPGLRDSTRSGDCAVGGTRFAARFVTTARTSDTKTSHPWTGEQGDAGACQAQVENGERRSRTVRGRTEDAAGSSRAFLAGADQTPRRVDSRRFLSLQHDVLEVVVRVKPADSDVRSEVESRFSPSEAR